MASRRHPASLAYPRRTGSTRSATRVDYHSLILVIGLLALAAFAGVLYLSQASVAAQLRYSLAQAERDAQDLWERNLAVRQEIAQVQRLATIEERAARIGMVGAPLTGPYVACVVPPAVPAQPQRPLAAAEGDSQGEAGNDRWRVLLRRLGLVRQPASSRLVALNAEHR